MKSKIAIPHKYGRNMFGVLDETGTLKYGEVFVQYSENVGYNESNLKIIEGTVVVTKNPCMHPGDVRKFEAIYVQSLKHIKDCIVFPSSGKRPHPDEMAGSDLDGDEYVVIWYPDLIFPEPNFPPMNYPVYKEKVAEKAFDVQDMIDFFCKYIMNDNIGVFGNAHLTWADQRGIFSDVCLSIARKYPFVLDFAKTGQSQRLHKDERPQIYPDFLEKKSTKSSYYSTKALGILYRVTRDLQESVDRIRTLQPTRKFDSNLCYPGWKKYSKSAEALKSSYNFLVERILEKFCINNEADAFSGYCHGIIYNQSSEEKYNTSLIVRTYIADIWQKYRLKFFKESELEFARMKNPISVEERNIRIYRRASAWYMAVYNSDDASRVFSMPWVIADVLADVRKECLRTQSQNISTDACFLRDAERTVQAQFYSTTQLLSPSAPPYCPCFQIAREVLKLWVTKTALNRKGCHEEWVTGFTQVFDTFVSSSNGEHGFECIVNASSTYPSLKTVIDFLKFSSFTPITFENSNISLQNASLQTLSNLVVTHDLGHLGIECKGFCDESIAVNDGGNYSELEGEEIRISMDEEENKVFLANNLQSIKEYLKETSGVKEIFITTDHDINYNWFLLINSIGTSWQRYHLEDIVLDANLFTKLENAIIGVKREIV